MYDLILPEGIGPYAEQHRSQGDYLQTVYEDFEMIKPHLIPGSVMDIGCGLGAVSVLAQRHCGGKLYLIDGTGWAKRRVGYGHSMEPFNDLRLTAEMMRLNGVTDYEFLPVGCPDLPEVDNCISTLSWGWHYPLSAYNPKAKVIITDVRPKSVGTVIAEICNGKGYRCKFGPW